MTTKERYTNELALELRDALGPKLGNNYPKYVFNTLHRKHLDPFTAKDEATMNEPIPSQAYDDFHNAISEAISTSTYPALLISIGGYSDTSSNPVNWTMFGKMFEDFLLDEHEQLPRTDNKIIKTDRFGKSLYLCAYGPK